MLVLLSYVRASLSVFNITSHTTRAIAGCRFPFPRWWKSRLQACTVGQRAITPNFELLQSLTLRASDYCLLAGHYLKALQPFKLCSTTNPSCITRSSLGDKQDTGLEFMGLSADHPLLISVLVEPAQAVQSAAKQELAQIEVMPPVCLEQSSLLELTVPCVQCILRMDCEVHP